MSQYDVAIIGAGINGLTAASYLAKAGKRVVVLERSSEAGGSAAAFDDAGFIPPRLISDLELGRHGFTSDQHTGRVFVPTSSGGWFVMHPDVAGTVQSLRAVSTRDAEKWPAFANSMARLAGFLQAIYDVPALRPQPRSVPDLMALAKVGRHLRGLGKTEMIEVLRTLPMSVAELLDDWFETDPLKGAIGARGIRGLMQGPRGGGTAFVMLHNQVGRAAGAFGAAPGVGNLVTALVTAARGYGAEIRTGAAVARVRVGNAVAQGVMLEDGSEIGARAVASSADPRSTFLGLVDTLHLEPEFVHAVRNIKFRGVVARVKLVLSEAPRCEGLAAGDVVSISPTLDYLERAFDHAKYGRTSEKPFIEARLSSQGGHSVLDARMQYAPYHLRSGAWDDAARTALGDLVVNTLNEYMPNVKASVLEREVMTPLDVETVYGVAEGNLDHGELTLDQILFMRPVAGWADYTTPIESLYLCGTGAHPGGSVAGGAGHLAARAILDGMSR
jgi:phytoene dehydrogenase-like protein